MTIKHTDADDETAGNATTAAGEQDPASPAAGSTDEVARERDELKDRLLRTAAEFDNFRKRTERERREVREAAAADLIRELLPVVDDLERALEAAESSAEGSRDGATPLERFREGVELIRRQVLDVLRRRGVEPLDVAGRPFDPNWHEAVAYEPAEGRPDGEIIDEVRRGYRLGDRLLRPAMVRVAKA